MRGGLDREPEGPPWWMVLVPVILVGALGAAGWFGAQALVEYLKVQE